MDPQVVFTKAALRSRSRSLRVPPGGRGMGTGSWPQVKLARRILGPQMGRGGSQRCQVERNIVLLATLDEPFKRWAIPFFLWVCGWVFFVFSKAAKFESLEMVFLGSKMVRCNTAEPEKIEAFKNCSSLNATRSVLGGALRYVDFHPEKLGKWSNWTNIFQMGTNDQLHNLDLVFPGSVLCQPTLFA